MRILLDEQLPRRLTRYFAGHSVRTVQQQGWAGVGNGELLRRAAVDGFEVLLTADRNLQNLAGSALRILVLVVPSNALWDLLPLVPVILQALPNAQPGE